MPITDGSVSTKRADRYLAQLCDHLDHLQHLPQRSHGGHDLPRITQPVHRTGDTATVTFDIGCLHIQATPDQLRLQVEADDASDGQRLQALVTNRLTTIGHRDNLTVTWQPPT